MSEKPEDLQSIGPGSQPTQGPPENGVIFLDTNVFYPLPAHVLRQVGEERYDMSWWDELVSQPRKD